MLILSKSTRLLTVLNLEHSILFCLFLPKIISFHILQSPPQCCTALSNIRFHNPLDSAGSDWPSLVFTPGHSIRALSAFLKEQGANNMQWAPLLGLSLLLNSLFYHCGRLRRVLPARSFVIGLKVLLLTLHRAKQRAWGPSTEFLVCQSCLPYHPLHGPIQRDQSVIEMDLYMNIKKRKRWIAHFMPSTADPSQRCQAHFAGGTYNTIKSCNMAKVSVRILQREHKLHRQVKAYPVPAYLQCEMWPSIQRNSRHLFCARNVSVSENGLISLFSVFWIRRYLWCRDRVLQYLGQICITPSVLQPLGSSLTQPRNASLPFKGHVWGVQFYWHDLKCNSACEHEMEPPQHCQNHCAFSTGLNFV